MKLKRVVGVVLQWVNPLPVTVMSFKTDLLVQRIESSTFNACANLVRDSRKQYHSLQEFNHHYFDCDI